MSKIAGEGVTRFTENSFTSELVKEFSVKRVTPSPAIFDMEKLYWLNRHYLKQSSLERVAELARPFFRQAGLLPESLNEEIGQWFRMLLALLVPYVDKLEQLPQKASIVFHYDAA